MELEIKWLDANNFRRFENGIGAIGDKRFKLLQVRVVRRVGDMAKTRVTRALAKQTGLKVGVIRRAIGKPKHPTFANPRYVITTAGGRIGLQYFKPKETRRGVTAYPFGRRTLFKSAFMKGGKFPGRVMLAKMRGNVMMPDKTTREWGRPFEMMKSDVVIPKEMVQGKTAEAFDQGNRRNLIRRVEHELGRMLG